MKLNAPSPCYSHSTLIVHFSQSHCNRMILIVGLWVFVLFQEGNLKRYPTPYPDELKNMVKTAQSVAHRLKEDESGDESGKDAKPIERNHIGVQDVGVKVSLQKNLSLSFLVYFILQCFYQYRR